MSPMLTLWLLSGAGAVVFFAVGYLTRAQKKAGVGEISEKQADASAAQLAALQDELQRQHAAGVAASVEVSRLQEILEQTRRDEAELKSQLEGQGRAAGQLLAERSDLHEKLGEKTREAQSSADQFVQLKQELDQLRNVRTPGAENQQELGLERKLRADAEEHAAVIAADLEAAADQARAGADKKQQEHDLKVENWWNDTGEDLWNSRVPVEGGLLGTDVFILRYTRHREERLAFITVEVEDRSYLRGKRYSIRSGGMVGERWDGGEPSISTYSSSSASGKTLQEAVYSLCA